jgi:membrane-bound lytic murein transglycosylase D
MWAGLFLYLALPVSGPTEPCALLQALARVSAGDTTSSPALDSASEPAEENGELDIVIQAEESAVPDEETPDTANPAEETAAEPVFPLALPDADPASGPDNQLTLVFNERVERGLRFWQSPRIRPVFSRWLARTRRYFPVVHEILEQQGLPRDLAAVALIESGLYYAAVSRASATGPWQFIRGTARQYGLKMDFWVDERRDIVRATEAAARHLADLYVELDDWYLAFAAYNAGMGAVERAIRKTGTRDYFALAATRALSRETRMYVPKILSAALILKDPAKFGFDGIDYLPPLEWEEVEVQGMADLRAAARAVNVTPELMQELNPELKYWCSPPYLSSYRLKIPKGSTERFLANYRPEIRDHRTTFARHRMMPGETLSHLALAYRTSVDAIMAANGISNPRRIRAGRILLVPVQPCGNPVPASSTARSASKKSKGR